MSTIWVSSPSSIDGKHAMATFHTMRPFGSPKANEGSRVQRTVSVGTIIVVSNQTMDTTRMNTC